MFTAGMLGVPRPPTFYYYNRHGQNQVWAEESTQLSFSNFHQRLINNNNVECWEGNSGISTSQNCTEPTFVSWPSTPAYYQSRAVSGSFTLGPQSDDITSNNSYFDGENFQFGSQTSTSEFQSMMANVSFSTVPSQPKSCQCITCLCRLMDEREDDRLVQQKPKRVNVATYLSSDTS